uniref:Uncharacterized protein n=1 Tax=Sphaerodactylus townsendi TaxID=933632 RepID=A0ACB8G0E2_9SAUR
MEYEAMVIERSSRLGIVGGELVTVAKLAVSLAYMKLCSGNLPLAVQLGYRGHQMCVQMKKFKLDYSALSNLFNALFLSIRFEESVQVLSWLEDLSFRDNNIIGKALFISGCLDLLLYAGPFEQARRLVRRLSGSLADNYGFCKFVECEALLLKRTIDEKPDKVREMRSKIFKHLEQILTQCSTSPVYYPRIYHLKAYVNLMLGNDARSERSLEKAFQSCNENKLEKSWLESSKEWWFTGMVPMEDWWLKTAPHFPEWTVGMAAADVGSFEKNKYLLKMPVLDADKQLVWQKQSEEEAAWELFRATGDYPAY